MTVSGSDPHGLDADNDVSPAEETETNASSLSTTEEPGQRLVDRDVEIRAECRAQTRPRIRVAQSPRPQSQRSASQGIELLPAQVTRAPS